MNRKNIIATIIYLVFALSLVLVGPFESTSNIILIIIASSILGVYRKYLKKVHYS
ncbi:hypothetical protein [Gottfriedia acidiceleris]|uniref:hypothetical protein n=1 Tax=Gottfriedia acidiceleris TaxID=371036 RepID=UPI0013EE1618|nr:hypothetical protein [Gottfriedia acidiceleris]